MPFVLTVFVWLPLLAQDSLSLPRIFSDHMVLQREMPVQIWGTASPGTEVRVMMADQTSLVRADAKGAWRVTMPPRPAGGPYTLRVEDGKTSVNFKDVLFGEVWLCSGQSNMFYSP
ncbi:MAG: hypothetical protein RLY31_1132, partial [Bacteroidota bacterium]